MGEEDGYRSESEGEAESESKSESHKEKVETEEEEKKPPEDPAPSGSGTETLTISEESAKAIKTELDFWSLTLELNLERVEVPEVTEEENQRQFLPNDDSSLAFLPLLLLHHFHRDHPYHQPHSYHLVIQQTFIEHQLCVVLY